MLCYAVRASSAGSVGVEGELEKGELASRLQEVSLVLFSRSICAASSLSFMAFFVRTCSAALSPHVSCVSAVRLPLAWIDQSAPADYFRLEGSLLSAREKKKEQVTNRQLLCA